MIKNTDRKKKILYEKNVLFFFFTYYIVYTDINFTKSINFTFVYKSSGQSCIIGSSSKSKQYRFMSPIPQQHLAVMLEIVEKDPFLFQENEIAIMALNLLGAIKQKQQI